MDDNLGKLVKDCSKFNFKAFKYTEHCSNTLEAHNIDSGSNLYITENNECMYYTDEQFSKKLTLLKDYQLYILIVEVLNQML